MTLFTKRTMSAVGWRLRPLHEPDVSLDTKKRGPIAAKVRSSGKRARPLVKSRLPFNPTVSRTHILWSDDSNAGYLVSDIVISRARSERLG